jgi:hypothetical protein
MLMVAKAKDLLVQMVTDADNPYLNAQVKKVQVEWVVEEMMRHPAEVLAALVEAEEIERLESYAHDGEAGRALVEALAAYDTE